MRWKPRQLTERPDRRDETDAPDQPVFALQHDGAVAVRRSATGTPGDAEKVGRDLAEEMLVDGASKLIEERAS